MLNDWGIYHLHLGTTIQSDGFVEQDNDELLFARITPTKFYLINVMKHGDWERKLIVEILHSNWPETIN